MLSGNINRKYLIQYNFPNDFLHSSDKITVTNKNNTFDPDQYINTLALCGPGPCVGLVS